MSNKRNGIPAFPVPGYKYIDEQHFTQHVKAQPGMTLRDYFAAKAMQGWLSGYADQPHPASTGSAFDVAVKAYVMADAMLRAREAS